MTKVPQHDWSRLMPKQPKRVTIVHYQPKRGGKRKATKIIDRKLFNDEYDNQQHLRQISLED